MANHLDAYTTYARQELGQTDAETYQHCIATYYQTLIYREYALKRHLYKEAEEYNQEAKAWYRKAMAHTKNNEDKFY